MYRCVRCKGEVALEDALCRSFMFGHCVCLRCFPGSAQPLATLPESMLESIAVAMENAERLPLTMLRGGCCALCCELVPADDVGLSAGRRFLCVSCTNRVTGRDRIMPRALRLRLARILDEIEA